MSHSEGISLRKFADKIGVTEATLRKWCRAGKVIGARLHPLTRKWVIYPPAKLALDNFHPKSLRCLGKGGAA